ncbi:Crp/Fnr family transcriptional regulator [Ramlibacter sp. USB13]|uniref:Crp/Fnr family transcriptional regulator n=1 Tax=Ramlibacter cellulosilyticus TaxID=2764187 RepID=A0A923MST1_9BURK|nr:Crp/Fnr family transcriptional regulator [Ramlibacter cellulosilyticus]MBC5783959.1 Crp/Fnr family transcriptional regulator [Ramlibacter cellulosilyticus]
MNVSRAAIEQDRLLATLEPSLARLAARGIIRNYRKSTIILNEGEPGDSLFVLLQGQVKVYATDENGREITYGTIQAGDYFGEMSLDGGPRSASVMTLEPSLCALVSKAAVQQHLADEPGFALQLVTQVIRRARSATETARQMALMDVYGRVIHTLEGQQGPASTQAPIQLTQITHQQIASRVGASREMVSRLLKDLEKGGYVELGIKRITLKKKLPARW